MEERRLRDAAIVISLAGLAALFLVSYYYSPERVPVYGIDGSLEGKYVETSGIVAGVKDAGGTKIVELWNLSSISVPLFFDAGLQVGDTARVRGVVKSYKGELEVVPSGQRDIEFVSVNPRFVNIREISDTTLYEHVLLRGSISDLSPKGDFMVATLNDSTGIIRLFLSGEKVSKGDYVEVSGIVKRYYSSLELMPREIRRIS